MSESINMYDGFVVRIVIDPITRVALKLVAAERMGDLVKAVVDIERGIMAIGGEMHADEEQALLDNGSRQEHLWGINIYLDVTDENWIEFDSMINIRPRQNNRSRNVDDPDLRSKIHEIVKRLII